MKIVYPSLSVITVNVNGIPSLFNQKTYIGCMDLKKKQKQPKTEFNYRLCIRNLL